MSKEKVVKILKQEVSKNTQEEPINTALAEALKKAEHKIVLKRSTVRFNISTVLFSMNRQLIYRHLISH